MSGQSKIALSYGEFENVVKRFSSLVPEFCLRHQTTAHLAFILQKLRLQDTLKTRFTVAIVGQMRVGKSTLLNALIGKDIAPTGTVETTATINWFRQGQGTECSNFRVHWSDGSTTDVPLERANEWVGTGKNAQETRCLDFFADTDFLKTANVVDTPGTRSVIQTHEEATQGFLAERLEEATLQYGGSADAVIYAINPVGKESDHDMLQLFGERTRLPGASAYNSIAVVQKWESLLPDPLIEVNKKCKTLRQQLEGKVAAVVPTSGLLARHAATVSAAIWQDICDLSIRSTDKAIEDLLLNDKAFIDEVQGAVLDTSARRGILESVSWKIIPLCINLARREHIVDSHALRTRVDEASGIPALRDLLQKHFFSRARLIKASTVLRKAWEPCEIALQTLRREIDLQKEIVGQGRSAHAALQEHCKTNHDLEVAEEYVTSSLAVVERDILTLTDIQEEIDNLKYTAKRNFDLFDRDLDSLKLLEAERSTFSQEEANELSHLFGQEGPELHHRLGLADHNDILSAKSSAQERFTYWSMQRNHSRCQRADICAHACYVMDLILTNLENIP